MAGPDPARASPDRGSALRTLARTRTRPRAPKGPEAHRPASQLNGPRSDRLHEQIREQPQQASGVARGVQKERIFGPGIVRSREP